MGNQSVGERRSGFESLRDWLRRLYHGRSRGAQRFQTTMIIVDFVIIAFFIATPVPVSYTHLTLPTSDLV